MNALEAIASLTEIHTALWAAHGARIKENGDDDIARGLFNSAQYVGDAASTLSTIQHKMAAHYALSDMLTGTNK